MGYRVAFAEAVAEHLLWLTANERTRVFTGIEQQLLREPLVETRNRKPLRPNPVAPWELRLGALRVFYEVRPEAPNVVRVLAIGKKQRQRLRIGSREIEL
jgi:mRNA-degrading endonuclease RelE of RelBE toxin-antitoxin system